MSKKLIFLTACVLMLGVFLVGAATAAEPGLVGWWAFDEGSGTIANDSSGNGNHGTVGGVNWVEGKMGGALEYDGAAGPGVEIPFSESLRVLNQGDLTLTAWFKPSEVPASNRVVLQQGDLNGTGRTWLFYRSSDASIATFLGGGATLSGVNVEAGVWVHAAVVVTEEGATDTIQMYINGQVAGAPGSMGMEDSEGDYYIGRHKNPNSNVWAGLIDEVRLYNRKLTQGEITRTMLGRDPRLASDPNPADAVTDVPRDVVLSWTPGQYAAAVNGHIVYIGQTFGDVNNAIGGTPQSASSYDPGQLAFETTYYWRVDEVNAPPDSTVFKGATWSFTTEPVGYPIDGANITATASSTGGADFGPEKTIDGSGLDADGLHSTDAMDMWLSDNEPSGAWIQYEFDKVQKLHQMWVWNSNQIFEGLFGFGMKAVTVEYSTNGTDWTTLSGVPEFAQATGTADYAYNTTVDFGGAMAKYIKLTATSNWGGVLPQYGLSEVRFFSIPVSAREPSPDSGAADVHPDVTLSWRAGREAAAHNVYISTDQQAVIDGNVPLVNVTEASYSSALNLGSTYYWRVDEVNEAETPTTWQGDVWSFSTPEYLVVDSFEDYNDWPPYEIYTTWVDGYENPANGSQVGHLTVPSVETTIVHGDAQSMPLFYSNTGGATYSEATRTFAAPQDWTKYGIQTLGLWFHGSVGNTGQLYVKINGVEVQYDGDAGNLAFAMWQPWNIDLAAAGVNLASVTTLSIGIDGNAAAGTLYFDDIRLYAYPRQLITPVQPDPAGLTAQWAFDDGSGAVARDSSGNGNDGTFQGNPLWAAGLVGGALEFNGTSDYVVVPFSESLRVINQGDFSIAAWFRPDEIPSEDKTVFQQGDDTSGGVGRTWLLVHNSNEIRSFLGGATTSSGVGVEGGIWYHSVVVVTEGGDTDSVQLYVNGQVTGAPHEDSMEDSEGAYYIGAHKAPGNFWDGVIDDVRFYNRALSPAEIAGLAGRAQPFDESF